MLPYDNTDSRVLAIAAYLNSIVTFSLILKGVKIKHSICKGVTVINCPLHPMTDEFKYVTPIFNNGHGM